MKGTSKKDDIGITKKIMQKGTPKKDDMRGMEEDTRNKWLLKTRDDMTWYDMV